MVKVASVMLFLLAVCQRNYVDCSIPARLLQGFQKAGNLYHFSWVCHCEPFGVAQDKLREAISGVRLLRGYASRNDRLQPTNLLEPV